jgi:restriction system protein
MTDHRRAEADRQQRLAAAFAAYNQQAYMARQQIEVHNQAVDAFEGAFRAGEPEAVEDYFSQLLALQVYPTGFPGGRRIAYRPEPRELWVEAELPDRAIVPDERGFKYVRTASRSTLCREPSAKPDSCTPRS